MVHYILYIINYISYDFGTLVLIVIFYLVVLLLVVVSLLLCVLFLVSVWSAILVLIKSRSKLIGMEGEGGKLGVILSRQPT